MRDLSELSATGREALASLDVAVPEQLLTFAGGLTGLLEALRNRGRELPGEDLERIRGFIETQPPLPPAPDKLPTGLRPEKRQGTERSGGEDQQEGEAGEDASRGTQS